MKGVMSWVGDKMYFVIAHISARRIYALFVYALSRMFALRMVAGAYFRYAYVGGRDKVWFFWNILFYLRKGVESHSTLWLYSHYKINN